MNKYTDTIRFSLAKALHDHGFDIKNPRYFYAVGNKCWALREEDKCQSFFIDGALVEVEDYDLFDGDFIVAPTYAEVFDWFCERGIFISVNAYFTLSLFDHIGYAFDVLEVNDEQAKLDKLEKKDGETGWLSSFQIGAEEAIGRALSLLKNDTILP